MPRIQSTSKFRVSNGPSMGASFATLPTTGNGVFVIFAGWNSSTDINWQAGDVTDNQGVGNVYTLAVRSARVGNNRCAIFYCESIGATSGTFTVNINPAALVNFWGAGVALEYSAVSASALDQTATSTGSGTAETTGATGTTAQADELILACTAISVALTAITVEATSPTWTEEAEELSFTTYLPFEADSKIVSAAAAYTGNWTHTINAGSWTAAIATFKLATPAAAGKTFDSFVVSP